MSFLYRLLDLEPVANAYIYVLFVGALHALLVGLAALALSLNVPLSGWQTYLRRLRRFLLANALLLAFGAIGNGFWMAFVYGHRYVSQDTLIDFFPFIPFGQWALNMQYGGKTGNLLNGASLWELRGLWVLVAGGVWTATIVIYRGITKGTFLTTLVRIVRLEELAESPSPELR